MYSQSYIWRRPNENVRFSGFTPAEIAVLSPALSQTDLHLKENKRLDARFIKKSPTLLNNRRVAAETHYHMFGGKATVRLNPDIFKKNRYQWDPAGVASHEIGHLVGPTRNTTYKERKDFKKAFSYRQKKVYHELAPQVWAKRRDNPVKGLKTRQSTDAAEDFSETWRMVTGQPFTNKTNQKYFNVVTTPKRIDFMERYYLK